MFTFLGQRWVKLCDTLTETQTYVVCYYHTTLLPTKTLRQLCGSVPKPESCLESSDKINCSFNFFFFTLSSCISVQRFDLLAVKLMLL